MPVATTNNAQHSNPFIKHLASSDRSVRDRALSSLRTYLHRTTAFTPLEFLKLWKGLFYCMWMSDKPRNQQRLARDLAHLVNALRPNQRLGFIEAFWKTIAREWGGIDALRMDKYLYLVRCYVGKGFEEWAKDGWVDDEGLAQYLKVLEAVPFNVGDGKIPNGLRYHVIDVYVEELEKADVEQSAPVEVLLAPLRRLSRLTLTKPVRIRALEALQDERLSNWKGPGPPHDQGDGIDEHVAVKDAVTARDGPADEDEEFGGFED